jgi:hypothetical protein
VAVRDPLVVRLPVHWESYLNVVLATLVFPIGAFFLVRGIQLHSLAAGLAGATVCLLMLPLLILSGRELLLRPTLRTRSLVLPWGITGSRHLQLADLSGVGLLFDAGGPRSEWVLWVWMADGNRYAVELVRTFVRGHKQPHQPPAPSHIPRRRRPRLDWAAIAATPAGRTTTTIYQQALQLQGVDGPLAARMDQCTAAFLGVYLAFWSPDGQIGWLSDRSTELLRDDTQDELS